MHTSVCPAVTFFVFDQLLENALTYLPQTLSTHPSLAAEEPSWNWVTGSKVKVTRVKCAQTVKVTILKMNFFFIHLCNLFELTNPVVQNICNKKGFRGHKVLQISFVKFVFV